MKRAALLTGSLLVLTVACSSPLPPPVPSDAPELATYTPEEIRVHARQLLEDLEISANMHDRILNRLEVMLMDREFQQLVESRGVNAVGAYDFGGGGFLMRGGSGNMLMDFAGGSEGVAYETDGWSFGANVGGENSFGVVLAVGLRHPEDLVDSYSTSVVGGTAANSGWIRGEGEPSRNNQHEIHYAGVAVGLSSNLSFTGRLTIEPVEGEDGASK